MSKYYRISVILGLALMLSGVLFVFSLNPAMAQSVLWQQLCAGQVQVTQQGGEYQVTCYSGSPTATPTGVAPTATPAPPSSSIIVDQNSIAQFEQIPQQYLTSARNLKVLFMDRSVGQNFDQALNCLSASSFGASPSYCRRHFDAGGNMVLYNQSDFDAGRVPEVIRFAPSSTTLNRSNWVYEYADGTWSQVTCNFIQTYAPAHMDKDVLSYQFNYLMAESGSSIMRFWDNNPNECDIYDLEAFMAQNPTKTFVFWTLSLSRSTGTQETTDFNNRMRQYATDNHRILFDFAAVESYTQAGQPCYDNRDGVPFTSPSNSNYENYPNDGLNLPAICPDYTTETSGGHLGSVSGGRIRTAKAFWVLMARIAGWQP